jgi:hypothetical protein
VYLLVGLGPVELAVLVGDIPVERGDRRVDQLGDGLVPLVGVDDVQDGLTGCVPSEVVDEDLEGAGHACR